MEELKDILSRFNANDLEAEKNHIDKKVWPKSTTIPESAEGYPNPSTTPIPMVGKTEKMEKTERGKRKWNPFQKK